MAYAGRVTRRAAVRPAVVLAVFFGLFLMHGSTLAAGCDGAWIHQGATTRIQMPAMSLGSPMAPVGRVSTKALGRASVTVGAPAGHGPLCLAFQPRVQVLAAVALGMILVFALVVPPLLGGEGRQRPARGPPRTGGSALLTRLCISRT